MAKNRKFPVVIDIINVLSMIIGVAGCLIFVIAFFALFNGASESPAIFGLAFGCIVCYISFSCLYHITKAACIYIDNELNKE